MIDKQLFAAKVCAICGLGFLLCVFAAVIWPAEMDIDSSRLDRSAVKDSRGRSDVIDMDVTAYCPCEKCCGKFSDGITASGRPAKGFLVAAPADMPFGTLLVIPGYANGQPVPVLDRGGAIKGNKLDIFFSDHQTALNWGRQKLKVKLVKNGTE